MKYWVLKPDGSEEEGEVEWQQTKPGFLEIQECVIPLLGGNLFQRDPVYYNGTLTDMFHAGLGRFPLAWREPLLENPKATAIYLDRWPDLHPHDEPETIMGVFGNAVIFEQPIWV